MRDEKRDFTRLALHAKAILQFKNLSSGGRLENLSLKGAFVAAARQAETNEVATLAICNTPISVKAKVVRVTDQGVGQRVGLRSSDNHAERLMRLVIIGMGGDRWFQRLRCCGEMLYVSYICQWRGTKRPCLYA